MYAKILIRSFYEHALDSNVYCSGISYPPNNVEPAEMQREDVMSDTEEG